MIAGSHDRWESNLKQKPQPELDLAGRVGGGRYAGGRYAHVSRPIARPGVGYGGRYAGYGGRYGYGYRPWGGVAAGAAVGAAAAGAYGYYNNNYYNNGCYQNNYGNWICPNQHQY